MAVIRKNGNGHPTKIMNKKTLWSSRSMFNNKNSVSQQEAASKFNCSKFYIDTQYTDEQMKTVKSQCHWMIRQYGGKSFVLDDESYFPLSKSQMPGKDCSYTKDKSTTPPKVKYNFKHKHYHQD